MTNDQIIKIIEHNFLCVRKLPYVVKESWYARENEITPMDCTEKWFTPDLSYFINSLGGDHNTVSAQKMMNKFYEKFPNGRKLITKIKVVKNGGLWLVKEQNNTSSTVMFTLGQQKYNKTFVGNTLEDAIKLFLKDKENV